MPLSSIIIVKRRTATHIEKTPFRADLECPRSPILIERCIEESSVVVSTETLVQDTLLSE